MISGTSIYEAIHFVDAVNKDISRLIDAADGGMQEFDYVSLWGTACYFNGSKAPSNSRLWVPHSFTRVYVAKQEMKSYTAFAFLNIYLTPRGHREPLVHWGVGNRKNGADLWATWSPVLLGPQGPTFLKSSEVAPFENPGELALAVEAFRHAVSPLVKLSTAATLEQMILDPLKSELARLPPPFGPTEDGAMPITPYDGGPPTGNE